MTVLLNDVLQVLDSALGLKGRSAAFKKNTPLLGAVAELDSMAVVSLVSALEEHFDLHISDEDLTAASFASVGSLCAMLERRQTA